MTPSEQRATPKGQRKMVGLTTSESLQTNGKQDCDRQTQVIQSLAQANTIRIEMAAIKRGIKSGTLDPVEVVQTCDLPIPVSDILTAIPYVGATKARTAMIEMHLQDRHVLGGVRRDGRHPITAEQRIRLAEHVAWRVTGSARWGCAA